MLGPDKIRYLQKLLAIKEKWASAFAPHMFMAGTHTTSRIEAMNSWLKQTLDHKSSLIDVMNTFDALDRRVEQMNLEGPVRQQVYEHPLLKSMTKTMSRYAFEHMLYQFSQSNHHRVRFTKKRCIPLLEEGQYIMKEVTDGRKGDTEVVQATRVGQGNKQVLKLCCSCRFNRHWGLACEHIFSVLNHCQVRSLDNIMIASPHWLRNR